MEFVKPGRHFYTVNIEDEFYLHRCIIRNREEDLVKFNTKKAKKLVKKRKSEDFYNPFSDYQEEYEVFKHFENDKQLWQVQDLVTDSQSQFELFSFLQ